ncbi:MAG TPA: hypothetical protein ENJ50_05075, partial [Planctomycetaceae bacterium]|nr:hypothetical protein [Planctomycetaceae bacterium]
MSELPSRRIDRRHCLAAAGCAALAGMAGCRPSHAGPPRVDKVWGRRGISEGRFQRPRAIAVDKKDRLYIVDMT